MNSVMAPILALASKAVTVSPFSRLALFLPLGTVNPSHGDHRNGRPDPARTTTVDPVWLP